ncbi:zwei Ig domain protein zig-8, partial [Aplysia californica]|uniref:Zwei Ig domain protein zig-8 n=1 Tax=Aplysia californica TaxID=6500 RepID=A0ABM1A3S4_APLCA
MSWITHGLTLLNPEIFCAWTLLSLLLHTLALSGMEVEAGLADGLVKKNVTKVSSSNSGTRMVSDEQQEGEEEDAPYFLNTQRFISVFRGKMAILPCSVKHLGKRQVAWRRLETDEFLTIGKMVWSKDPRIVLEHKAHRADITSWDILLRNAKDEDAGYYECQVTSSEHLIWTLQLIVLEPV